MQPQRKSLPKSIALLAFLASLISALAWVTTAETSPVTSLASLMPAALVSASIPPDTTPPTGSIDINSGAAYTNTTSVSLGVSASDDGSGIDQMQFSNYSTNGWSAFENYTTSKSWVVPSGDGLKTVYARFRDVIGNISTWVSDTITLDTSVPPSYVLGTVGLDKALYSGPMDSAMVTVEDADADTTTGPGNDTLSVLVTSTADTAGETIALNEDASVAGRFTGTFGFEPFKAFSGNGKVWVSKGDTVTASYTDETTTSGSPQDVTATAGWDTGRAMWVWGADDIINNVGTARPVLYSFCAAPKGYASAKVDTIYLDSLSAVHDNPTSLSDFISDAHANGLRVECLAGAPEWATASGQATAEAAVDAVTAFNTSVSAEEGFDGIHFEVAPYSLGNWETETAAVWADYIAMLGSCKSKVDTYNTANGTGLTFAVDIPAWYDTNYNGVTSSDEVQDIADYVVVLAWKDTSAEITLVTQHELDYAESVGKKALIGIETACDAGYPANETFCGDGVAAMETELGDVGLNYSDLQSYLGPAINDYAGYSGLYKSRPRGGGPLKSHLYIVSLTPDIPSPGTAGTAVTWTATAAGGSGSYEYKFIVRYRGEGQVALQEYSPSNTFVWTPDIAGRYRVSCCVREAGSTAAWECRKGERYEVQ